MEDNYKLALAELAAERELYNQREDQTSAAAARFKGQFVLIKDPQYNTALPNKLPDGTAIPFASLRWDKEAKRTDATWDIDHVIKSTRFECPHCGGHIVDKHRQWLDAHGQWIPTRVGEPGHAGYQLSSFYQPLITDDYGQINFDSTWGGMANKFLTCAENGTIGGWINSDLAEVNTNQQTAQRFELNTGTPISQPDWIPLLTADFHKNHPYIWFVVRRWCPFKLLPPFGLSAGLPEFIPILYEPQNAAPLAQCLALIGCNDQDKSTATKYHPAWNVVAELMRFKSGETESPLIQFLLAQKITGEKLVKMFKEHALANTMDFRKILLWEMSKKTEGWKPFEAFRPARGGDSELLAAGHLDLSGDAVWEELLDIEKEFHVGAGLPTGSRATAIDCGFAEKFNRVVLQQCFERADHYQWYDPLAKPAAAGLHGYWAKGSPPTGARHAHCQVTSADGWYALRGKPTFRPLGTGKINHELNINIEDAYYGTPEAGSRFVEVLEIPQALFWLRKDDLGKKRTKNLHTISPHVSWFPKLYNPAGERLPESRYKLGDYEKQMNEQYYNEEKSQVLPRSGKGGSQNKRHPYHLDDCETYQIALATHHQFFERDAR